MGCYDFSCSLSHIPIHHDEPVVMLYLGTSADCSAFSKLRFGREWEPVSLPIMSTYDDYGEIEDVDATDIGQAFVEGPLMKAFVNVTPRSTGATAGLLAFKRNVKRGQQPYPDGWVGASGRCRWTQEYHPMYGAVSELVQSNGTSVSKVFIHKRLWDQVVSMGPIRDVEQEVVSFLEQRRRFWEAWEPTPMEKGLLKALDIDLASGDVDHFIQAFRDSGFQRDTPMQGGELARALTRSPSCSEGHPLNYNSARLILSAVDALALDGVETLGTLTVRDCLKGVFSLINVYHGTRRINQSLEPVVHTTSVYQQAEEALATVAFLDQAKAVQIDKLRRYYKDGFERCYDANDPVRIQLAALLPELSSQPSHRGDS